MPRKLWDFSFGPEADKMVPESTEHKIQRYLNNPDNADELQSIYDAASLFLNECIKFIESKAPNHEVKHLTLRFAYMILQKLLKS